MSGSLLLRLRVNERLEAAVEEIFGLVEKTITEYEEEAVCSKREIGQLKQQLEPLVVLKPKVILTRADTQEICHSQQPDCLVTEGEMKTHDAKQIREEQEEMSISPDVEADAFNVDEVRDPDSEPDEYCERLPTANESMDDDDERTKMDRSSSPLQCRSAELEQPPRGDKTCRFCGEHFSKDSFLIRHVATSHKGHKAFRCLDCKKEFDLRHRMVTHTRSHTGEKPCDFCDKTFTQNSSRLCHMKKHSGKKLGTNQKEALTCFECNKVFKRKQHLVRHKRVHTGEKPFSCDFCGKAFTRKSSLLIHMKWKCSVHNGGKPFGGGFSDERVTRKSARIIHMREHDGEKPNACEKCVKRFTSRGYWARRAERCTGTQNTNDLATQHVAEPCCFRVAFKQQLQVQE